jgi:hypothetical protein
MTSYHGRIPFRGLPRAAAALTFLIGSLAPSAVAANNLNNNGGPTMQNQIKAFLIYWLPSGVVLDTSVTNGVGNFETLTQQFYRDLSATSYVNIVTQYPGSCGSNECVVQNQAGAVALGGFWVDTQAYPHAGSQADPLGDADIQNEVKRAITQNHWSSGANTEFFVFTGVVKNTGKEIEECDSSGSNCTFKGVSFCAYHGNFGLNGGNAFYGFLSDASFNTAGCAEGTNTAVNTQLASDREVAMMSHEFFETITDPLGNAWWDTSTGNEIGDNCNQIPATVTMNSHRYVVQKQWSNASSSCVSSFGPSIQLSIGTGGDDLRGDSSATASLERPGGASFETVTLKTQNQSSWGNNSGHIVVGAFNQASQTALGQVAITLTSHDSFPETQDNWNIQNLTAKVLSPTGAVLCQQSLSGNPLARLTGSAGTGVFGTPNCQPPVPITATYNQITFNIVTGGDDLRGDSSATASVSLPGGAQTFTLKAQSDGGWENNSDHVKTFTISPPQPLSAFGQIGITLTSHNGTFETDDNWNIQSVNVTVTGSSGGSCVLNQSGDPLSRLTGSVPTVILHPRAGC